MNFKSLNKDSTAAHLKYVTSEVSCFYHDIVTDMRYRIKIKCPLSRGCFFSTVAGCLVRNATCYFERLDSILAIDKRGKYSLTSNEKCSSEILNGALIALGLSASEYPYLASIRMSGVGATLISVPVKSEDDITLETISEEDWVQEDLLVSKILGKSVNSV